MAADPRTPSAWAAIYAQVQRIPYGRVATYGQIAALAGKPRGARQVGYALYALPVDSSLPWHRVVNHRGAISQRAESDAAEEQQLLLEAEGLNIGDNGCVDLRRYRWTPEP